MFASDITSLVVLTHLCGAGILILYNSFGINQVKHRPINNSVDKM
jgi:fructose-1,6-bisphosphatase